MIRLFYYDLPTHVNGLSMVDEETGTAYIIVDPKQCVLRQRFAFGHELAHVFLQHHSSKRPLEEIEAEADREAWRFYRMHRELFYRLQRTRPGYGIRDKIQIK